MPPNLELKTNGIKTLSPLSVIETVYYSPFLDLSEFYSNFGSSPDIDISLDRTIQRDAENNEKKEGSNPILEHRYQNLLRQFTLQSSPLFKKLNANEELPPYREGKLTVRQLDVDFSSFHNTPYDFQSFFKLFYKLWKDEIYKTERQIRPDTDLEEDKRIFKLWFLIGLIRSILIPLESSNTYLFEGRVSIKPEDLEDLTLLEVFQSFLENHYFEGFEDTRLPVKEINDLIEFTFRVLDTLNKGDISETNEINIGFNDTREILRLYNNFLLGLFQFKKNATGFIDISPNIPGISSGEKAFLDLYSRFLQSIELIKEKRDFETINNYENGFPSHFILLLDEGDIGFHPVWKKKYVKNIISVLPKFFEEFQNTTVQIIFTTHDALTLSDIPNYNVVYLNNLANRNDKSTNVNPFQSFGANITSLLADSFFVEDGLVGDFAVYKINKTIDWLNDPTTTSDADYHQMVIEIIDEPLIQKKLSEMFSIKTGKNLVEERILTEQIKNLTERLNRIKGQQ
jgi:hypothetical protein